MATQHSKAAITAVVCAYFVVSIALVFSNKVLVTDGTAIPAPIFVTWFQCVLTVIIIWGLGRLSYHHSAEFPWLKEFPVQTFELQTATNVLTLSVIFVGMITFNNLCITFVEVSFYNVARSLTIVFNVIFTFLMLGESTSWSVLVCLAVVIAGFFIGAGGEVNFSLVGTVFGATSSVFVSLNSIFTKKAMTHVNDDKWRLAFYNNINASIMFIPLIFLTGEHNIIFQHKELLQSAMYWGIMSISGVLGFLIGIVTVMQITYTSPLTHNISGTAKACVQTFLALMIWRNAWTPRGMFGNFLVIFGSMAYAWVRMTETDRAKVQYKPLPTQAPEKEKDSELDIEMAKRPPSTK